MNKQMGVSYIASDFNDCPSLGKAFFFKGCNLMCPYCHNSDLVFSRVKDENQITIEEAADEIRNCVQTNKKTQKSFLTHEWIVISGGEPLISLYEAEYLIDTAKENGLKVKLFTNGLMPKQLKIVLPKVDAISIDIKEPPRRFCKIYSDFSKLQQSLDYIFKEFNGLIDFRTVCVAPFIYQREVEEIAEWLSQWKDVDKDFTWTLAKFLRQGKLVGDERGNTLLFDNTLNVDGYTKSFSKQMLYPFWNKEPESIDLFDDVKEDKIIDYGGVYGK